jgi:hypothetical protein
VSQRKGWAFVAMATVAVAVSLGGRPLDARASVVMSGAVAGKLTYSTSGGGCPFISWTASFSGVAGSADPPGNESVGVLSIAATGWLGCGEPGSQSGGVSLSLDASGAVGLFRCPSMTGPASRAGTIWLMTVGGDCTLNNQPEPGVRLTVTVSAPPMNIGGNPGVTAVGIMTVT